MLTSIRNLKMSSSSINSELAGASGTQARWSTVWRSLARSDLYGRIAAKKPYFWCRNKAKRLNYAQHYGNGVVEKWQQGLWTDESEYEIFDCSRWRFVCWKAAEQYIVHRKRWNMVDVSSKFWVAFLQMELGIWVERMVSSVVINAGWYLSIMEYNQGGLCLAPNLFCSRTSHMSSAYKRTSPRNYAQAPHRALISTSSSVSGRAKRKKDFWLPASTEDLRFSDVWKTFQVPSKTVQKFMLLWRQRGVTLNINLR